MNERHWAELAALSVITGLCWALGFDSIKWVPTLLLALVAIVLVGLRVMDRVGR